MIMVSIDPVLINDLLAAMVTLVMAVVAILKTREVTKVEKTAETLRVGHEKALNTAADLTKTAIKAKEETIGAKNETIKAKDETIKVKDLPAASNPIVTRAMEKAESNGTPGISEDEAGDFYRAIIADPETGPAQRAASEAWLKRHNK